MQISPSSLSRGLGIVIIGRNEGERFRACLASLPKGLPAVYVDSGSTDDSVLNAESAGVRVVHLLGESGFTAARARNLGWRTLLCEFPDLIFVQFVDGDCSLDPNWLAHAVSEIANNDKLAVIFGRRRERFPDQSIYNAQCDREWDVPVGEVRACGGDALIRVAALRQVDGYNDRLIAGEEPDMCLRMRLLDWKIRRSLPEMTMHDAAILTFGGWWKRAKRAGHAYAEHLFIHKRSADPDWRRAMASMVVWAMLLPGVFVLGLGLAFVSNPRWALLSLFVGIVFALQYLRLSRHGMAKGLSVQAAREDALLLIMAKFAHCAGAKTFAINKIKKTRSTIMEYK